MVSKRIATSLLLVLAMSAFGARLAVSAEDDATDAAMAGIHAEAIRADMRFLSDDSLEGRGTATRGHQIAAKFMATRFERLGLQPAGDHGTYFQSVPLRKMLLDAPHTSLALVRAGHPETLRLGSDFVAEPDPMRAVTSVEAPMVYVGFGVTAPEQHYDDYKGIDAKGKIVALAYGAPNFDSTIKAHYSSFEIKEQNAVSHGAVGMIVLDDPILERMYPFTKIARDMPAPHFAWMDKSGRPAHYFPELRGRAFVSLATVKRLLQGSGHTADEVFAAIKAGKTASFALPVGAKINFATRLEDVQSPNVVAKLEGSDPELKSEYVVYTAHLDHLGIGAPVKGDKIYNGALDNASGSATILSLARAFSSMATRPRRSILFVSVTGEEAGLLGSDYFATYPTVPKSSLIADINIDEVLMLWPLHDVIAFGAEHSSLGPVIKRAAERLHLAESPDPMPQEVVFIRSDQYSFVKQGIPAVMPSPGFTTGSPDLDAAKIFGKWEEERYHEPQDDIDQPGLDFDAAAQFARFAFLTGIYVADDAQRPTWNKGDFFGERYAGKTAQ